MSIKYGISFIGQFTKTRVMDGALHDTREQAQEKVHDFWEPYPEYQPQIHEIKVEDPPKTVTVGAAVWRWEAGIWYQENIVDVPVSNKAALLNRIWELENKS